MRVILIVFPRGHYIIIDPKNYISYILCIMANVGKIHGKLCKIQFNLMIEGTKCYEHFEKKHRY